MMSGREPLLPPNPHNKLDPRVMKLKIDRLYHDANKLIEEAISPEKLKENPYKGKPLHLEDNPFDRGLGMAHRMLKNAGHTLPWIETKNEILAERRAIHKAIDDHIAWLQGRVQRLAAVAPGEKERAKQAVREGHLRFIEHLRERVAKLRKVIERYNLEVPLFDQQVPNVRPESYVALVEERARALLAEMAPEEPEAPAGE